MTKYQEFLPGEPVQLPEETVANIRYWDVLNTLCALVEDETLPTANPDIDLLGQGDIDSLTIVEFMLQCEDAFPGLKTEQEDAALFSGPLAALATEIVKRVPHG